LPDIPTFRREKLALGRGYRLIAGVDEAGRGPLAGPVVAGAVILPDRWLKSRRSRARGDDPRLLVRDSKQLSESQRERAYTAIIAGALAWGVGVSSSQIIDAIGIVPATRRAMKQAISSLGAKPDYLLVDAVDLSETGIPNEAIIHGDALCGTIAAASIIAKVTRDRMMLEIDRAYPGYGFAEHKGYATPEHQERLAQLGPCAVHRYCFAPVKDKIMQRLL
jgi:ribonuclease HII